jgi:hypothetical protein
MPRPTALHDLAEKGMECTPPPIRRSARVQRPNAYTIGQGSQIRWSRSRPDMIGCPSAVAGWSIPCLDRLHASRQVESHQLRLFCGSQRRFPVPGRHDHPSLLPQGDRDDRTLGLLRDLPALVLLRHCTPPPATRVPGLQESADQQPPRGTGQRRTPHDLSPAGIWSEAAECTRRGSPSSGGPGQVGTRGRTTCAERMGYRKGDGRPGGAAHRDPLCMDWN